MDFKAKAILLYHLSQECHDWLSSWRNSISDSSVEEVIRRRINGRTLGHREWTSHSRLGKRIFGHHWCRKRRRRRLRLWSVSRHQHNRFCSWGHSSFVLRRKKSYSVTKRFLVRREVSEVFIASLLLLGKKKSEIRSRITFDEKTFWCSRWTVKETCCVWHWKTLLFYVTQE